MLCLYLVSQSCSVDMLVVLRKLVVPVRRFVAVGGMVVDYTVAVGYIEVADNYSLEVVDMTSLCLF